LEQSAEKLRIIAFTADSLEMILNFDVFAVVPGHFTRLIVFILIVNCLLVLFQQFVFFVLLRL